jgi:DNA-binding HxlR family transcriptional regulator
VTKRIRATPPARSGGPTTRGDPASTSMSDDELDRRFLEFTELARRFSHELVLRAGPIFPPDPVESAEKNVDLAKAIFGKWSIEILLVLYQARSIGFQDLRRHLKQISSRVLAQKLRLLEERGLVHRAVLPTRPTRVIYSLTDDGLILAKLGEPVFLFLRSRADRPHRSGTRGPAAAMSSPLPSSSART